MPERKVVIAIFRNKIWLRLFLLLLIIAGSILILYETGLIHLFLDKKSLINFLKSLGPLSFVGFIVLQAAQVAVAPIPGEVTGLLGGILYGPVVGILLSTIGLTFGSWIAFTLSKYFGRPFVERLIKKETIDRYDYLLHHKGAFLVFLLFLIPGFPKDSFCYILGLGHLSTKEFLIISTTGRFLGIVLLTLGGNYINNRQYYRLFALLGIAIIIVFLSMVYRDKIEHLFKKFHRHIEEKDKR